MNNLELKNISFSYGMNKVLNNINLSCTNGVITLLGHNGAGKTTLMNILAGMKKSNGAVILLNDNDIIRDSENIPKYIGYLPQNFEIYGNLTGYNFLSYVYDVKELEPKNKRTYLDEIIKRFNLSEVINKRFSTYSGGYKRRLGIAQAVMGSPKVIIIDEPTVGLDPEQRFEFRQYLSELGENSIVIISTHITEDVEFFANRILIIKNGEIDYDGDKAELLKVMENKVYEGILEWEDFVNLKEKLWIVEQARIENNKVKIKIVDNGEPVPNGFNKREATLEDGYLYYQKR